MNILLFGGTAFLGRHIAQQALHRGHSVTCLARGSEPPVNGTHFVRADRDTDGALDAVSTGVWDCVIDLTVHPDHARHVVTHMRTQHVIYISSSSVYAHQAAINKESDQVVSPLDSGHLRDMGQYPAAKSACEAVYRSAFEQVMVIRPGLIAGYGDDTGRSGYYPWRFMNPTGVDVLVPDPTFPVAMIDAEDLANWIVGAAEKAITGFFNATGAPTTLDEVFRISRRLSSGQARSRTVSDEELLSHGVLPWAGSESLPLWIPGSDMRNIALLDSPLAQAYGLVTRPLAETLAAALRYEMRGRGPRRAGLSDDKERQIRASLDSRAG